MTDKGFEELRRRIDQADAMGFKELFEHLGNDQLLHELSVYHAELLAQNEDLKSARDAAEEQAIANNALFESAPAAYFVLTSQGFIERFNKHAEDQMRQASAELGDSLIDLYAVGSDDLRLWLLDWKHNRPRILRFRQTEQWHQLIKERYSEDRTLITVSDITEVVESRDRYQEALAQLKQEKSKLMQGLAVLGHELRTPLASLKMMLNEQGVAGVKPYGDDILASTDHLLNVLDDLQTILDPSEVKESSLRTLSPYTLTERVITSLRFLFKENNIRVHVTGDEHSAFDYAVPGQAVRQIITNLLKNAAIHSTGTEVRVKIWIDEIEAKHPWLRIQVVDNGKGMSKEQVDTLFGAFERGDTESEGSGLGLFVCRQLATQLGGRLALQSQEGVGSRFVLELPISKVNSESQQGGEDLGDALEHKKVLLADDDQFQRMLMSKYLESMGAEVTGVADGKGALEALQLGTFDLLVSDLNMPVMDGVQLMSEINAREINVATIFVTGGTDPQTKERLLKLGALDLILKPVHAQQIAQAYLSSL